MNIFECLDKVDGEKLRSILDSSDDLTDKEHQLVCTFRLPKGKRPSRKREDIKVNITKLPLFVIFCKSRRLQWLAIFTPVMTPVMIDYLLLVVKL
jgi:hypothetical protein